MRSEDIPELPGYLTVATVAKMFGMRKESIFHKIYEQKSFQHVYRIGGKVTFKGLDGKVRVEDDVSQRPIIVLLESEVMRVFQQEMDSASAKPEPSNDLTLWNKRVKQWGRDTGWAEAPIQVNGRPPLKLVKAYLAANPADPRPE